MVENGHDLLSHGTLKSAIKNDLMNWADFLHVDTNSGKLKVTLKVTGWAWSSIGVAFFFQVMGH